MDVPEFLDALLFAPDVEVVVAGLPERFGCSKREFSRHGLFECLQSGRERARVRFCEKEMNVLRHYHVPCHTESVSEACEFQRSLEDGTRLRSHQLWFPLKTAERDEVKLFGLLDSVQSRGHDRRFANQERCRL